MDFLKGAQALLKILEVAVAAIKTPSVLPDVEVEVQDILPDYTQRWAGDFLVSLGPDGATRRENPRSGVIQENGADGSLTVSLPNGRILRQRYEGESLLVLDLEKPTAPQLAQVVTLNLEGERVLAYHFQEAGIHHVVAVESLRYYKLRQGT